MDDLLTRLVILPNSLLCASLGVFIGSWIGGLGVPIDGESHFLIRGALRGALSFGLAGWHLPTVILIQATSDARANSRGSFTPALLPNPIQLQLDLPFLHQYGARLGEVKQAYSEELHKLQVQVDFHKKRAEEATLAAAAASTLAAELLSIFELEDSLIKRQLKDSSEEHLVKTEAVVCIGQPK